MLRKSFYVLKRLTAFLFIIAAIGILLLLWQSKYGLEVTKYKIESPTVQHSFRIVQLSDQHGSIFGFKNNRLIRKVSDAKPDLILITGDLLDMKSGHMKHQIDVIRRYVNELTAIAPVYVSYGNHEVQYDKENPETFASQLEDTGAIVLEKSFTDIEVNGQKLRIGGIYGYCQDGILSYGTKREADSVFLREFEATDRMKILMSHMPACWLGKSLYSWDVDCVFAGHEHGGQIRIPGIGGLYAPDRGWFPGEECGVYVSNREDFEEYRTWKMRGILKRQRNGETGDHLKEPSEIFQEHYLVLSRGLGSTEILPRFNNTPEIVVVDFESDENSKGA